MAIDPSIALDYKPPTIDAVGSMQQGANLIQTQANTANTQAATAGIAADSANKETQAAVADRNFKGQQWLGANAQRFIHVDPQGVPQFDAAGLAAEAAKQGYADFVPHISDEYQKVASNQISQNTNEIDQTTKVLQMGRTNAGMLGVHVLSTPLTDRLGDYQAQRDAYIKAGGPQVASFLPELKNQDQVSAWARSATQDTISPLDQANLENSTKLATNTVNQTKATGVDAIKEAGNYDRATTIFQNGAAAIRALPPAGVMALGDDNSWRAYLSNVSESERINAVAAKQAIDQHSAFGYPTITNFNSGDKEGIAKILDQDQATARRTSGMLIEKGRVLGAPPSKTANDNPPPAKTASVPVITTQADYDALPQGAHFVDGNGMMGTKGGSKKNTMK